MKKEPKKHEKYSASSSERWLKCAGSIALTEKAPPSRDTDESIEGTTAHEAHEVMMNNLEDPNKARRWLKMNKSSETGLKFDDDMIEYAHAARNFVWGEMRKLEDPQLLVEEKVLLKYIHPELGGTLDLAMVEEFGLLTIYDYKYGKGFGVDPSWNTQLVIYALGIAKKYGNNFTHVRHMINQPRHDHEKGPIRHWTIKMKDLKNWEDIIKKGIDRCEKPNAKLFAGSHCHFCPAKAICPEISKKALAQAEIDFKDIDRKPRLPSVKSMAISGLGQKLKAAELIEFWIAELRAHAIDCLERGHEVPGFKLVGKRGTRKYLNETKTAHEAKKIFGAKAFTAPKLLSPAQLEKVSPEAKKFVAKRCSNISSGHTLATEDDPRPAIQPLSEQFRDVN